MNMNSTIYNQIYNKLICLIPNLEKMGLGHLISKVAGYSNLHLYLHCERKDVDVPFKAISLEQYEQNGGLNLEPSVCIRVYTQSKTAEALLFQNDMEYKEVYSRHDNRVNENIKIELSLFLESWLDDCINRGHKFTYNNQTVLI